MSESPPFLRRVSIRNYKSIAACDVKLGRFTLIVGRNGSGKSNFLDALRFINDGLQATLDHAIKVRGGIDEVRRKSTGHPHHFSFELELSLPGDISAEYSFSISAQRRGGFSVQKEELTVSQANGVWCGYKVRDGLVEMTGVGSKSHPAAVVDRLYLVAASGMAEFRPVYDALRTMGFYNLNPDQIKELQSPDSGETLRRDGSNLASVIGRISEVRPELQERIREYLQRIVPGLVDFERETLGPRETVVFRQSVQGSPHPWRFYAASMSDGTLRALGVLVAVMQLADGGNPIRLAAIEEPETALHPAAASTLVESLREASAQTQVIVTSHSPELIDLFDPDTDTLLVADAVHGTTTIGPVDHASWNAIQTHSFTAGELLRLNQLQPQAVFHQQGFVEEQSEVDVVEEIP